MKEAIGAAQIEAARQGNEVEMAALIAHFMPFIRRMARRFAGPGLDFDDAVQEGIIGLFSAIQHYHNTGRASFSTYATVCVQNAVFGAKRAAGRKKHRLLSQSIPIPREQSIPGPEDAAIASEQVHLTLEKARMVLSSMEKTVLRLYLNGLTHSQIAARMGTGGKAVENALARVRRKLR